jgi:uncharacterized protein with HEPN domain
LKRDALLYLDDILEAIQRIEEYSAHSDYGSFKQDKKAVDAIVRNFEIMGEAVNKVPSVLRKKYPDIPWLEMMGMRNKLIHEYFGVDTQILWKTIKENVPQLKPQVRKMLQDLEQGSTSK